MLLCLHEESAVAIAQGYAKVTGRAMAAAVHSNVGLMHATMAIFNAWCDRMPVIVLGATGPVDASSAGHGSTGSTPRATRARSFAATPNGTTSRLRPRRRARRFCARPGSPTRRRRVPSTSISMPRCRKQSWPSRCHRSMHRVSRRSRRAGSRTCCARRPTSCAAQAHRDPGRPCLARREDMACACRIGEALNAGVITNLKIGAAFPTDHPLHVGAPSTLIPDAEGLAALREADVILSLDWVDLAGTLKAAKAPARRAGDPDFARSPSAQWLEHGLPGSAAGRCLHRRRSGRGGAGFVRGARRQGRATRGRAARAAIRDWPRHADGRAPRSRHCAAVGDRPCSLTHLPLSWNGAWWPFRHPLDFLGGDGGGGVGGGPGISVGCALALKGTGRLPVAVCGDGDYLMGVTALWTAAHYRIPLLRWSPTIAPSSTTSCIRSASPACAIARWKIAGSASAFPIPISTLPPWRARRARRASDR